LTEARFGHNLVLTRTQHLVSAQRGKEAGNGTRRAFFWPPASGVFFTEES